MKHSRHARSATRRVNAITLETGNETATAEVVASPKINLARRTREIIMALPTTIKDQVREHPYRTLGLAFALGGGSGVVLGSRVLRMAFSSAASVVITRVVTDFLREEFQRDPGTRASA